MKSANILGWNIFLIQGLSMLTSPQIQTVKPPDKNPSVSDKSSFMRRRSVRFNSFSRTVLQHSPDQAAWNARWLTWFIRKIPKILGVLALYYESVRFIDTTPCRQLKLNLLSTKMNFYSWFATTWQGSHVGGQNKRIFPRRIYMKIEFSSQRREMLLFLTTNMAAVTSRANQQLSNDQ